MHHSKRVKQAVQWIHNQPRSGYETENIALEALLSAGLPAFRGVNVSAPFVDFAVDGVWIEGKYSPLHVNKFYFNFSPAQVKRGVLAHVILLTCEYEDRRSFHLFNWNAPYFYKADGSLKTGLTFTPDKFRLGKGGTKGHNPLTQPVMDAAEDDWQLVHDWHERIKEALLRGERPTYGKPFAR